MLPLGLRNRRSVTKKNRPPKPHMAASLAWRPAPPRGVRPPSCGSRAGAAPHRRGKERRSPAHTTDQADVLCRKPSSERSAGRPRSAVQQLGLEAVPSPSEVTTQRHSERFICDRRVRCVFGGDWCLSPLGQTWVLAWVGLRISGAHRRAGGAEGRARRAFGPRGCSPTGAQLWPPSLCPSSPPFLAPCMVGCLPALPTGSEPLPGPPGQGYKVLQGPPRLPLSHPLWLSGQVPAPCNLLSAGAQTTC